MLYGIFENQNQKVKEKLKLFSNTEALIYCKDYLSVHNHIIEDKSFHEVKLFTWSKKTRADLLIGRITKNDNDCEIQGIFKNLIKQTDAKF